MLFTSGIGGAEEFFFGSPKIDPLQQVRQADPAYRETLGADRSILDPMMEVSRLPSAVKVLRPAGGRLAPTLTAAAKRKFGTDRIEGR